MESSGFRIMFVAALLLLSLLVCPAASAGPAGGPGAQDTPAFQWPLRFDAGDGPSSLAIGDLNGDGNPDLAVANSGSDDVSVLLGNGNGAYQPAVSFPAGDGPAAVAIEDLDGDGNPDLAVASQTGLGATPFDLASVPVSQGGFLYFVVDPDGDYGCDSTGLDLTIEGGGLTWNLADDFRLSPDQANPGPDGHGNEQVWHYMESASFARDPATYSLLPDFITDAFLIEGLEQWQGTQGSSPNNRLPAVGINASGAAQEIDGLSWAPGIVRLHPSSSKLAVVGWQSPIDGTVSVHGSFDDLDTRCGNGIAWYVEDGTGTLAQGPLSTADVSILLGNGDGTFQAPVPYEAGSDSRTVAIGDLNGDDVPDLVVGNGDSGDVSVLLGNGDGTFQAPVSYATATPGAHQVVLGDLDGDLDLDLVVATGDPGISAGQISVHLGNGDGSFQPAVGYYDAGTTVAIGDMDGDGNPDLIGGWYNVHFGWGGLFILTGAGDGTFTPGFTWSTYGIVDITAADLVGDEAIDLAWALDPDSVVVAAGNGDGTINPFEPSCLVEGVGDQPVSIASGDLNGDGKTDLVVANRTSDDVAVLINELTVWGLPASVLGQGSAAGSRAAVCVACLILPLATVFWWRRRRRRP